MHSCRAGPNPLHPDRLTARERIGEICRLLALGLVRLRMRERGIAAQSSGQTELCGESSLDCAPGRSTHATKPTRRTA